MTKQRFSHEGRALSEWQFLHAFLHARSVRAEIERVGASDESSAPPLIGLRGLAEMAGHSCRAGAEGVGRGFELGLGDAPLVRPIGGLPRFVDVHLPGVGGLTDLQIITRNFHSLGLMAQVPRRSRAGRPIWPRALRARSGRSYSR